MALWGQVRTSAFSLSFSLVPYPFHLLIQPPPPAQPQLGQSWSQRSDTAPSLQEGKLRHRSGKRLVQGHRACWWLSWDWNASFWSPRLISSLCPGSGNRVSLGVLGGCGGGAGLAGSHAIGELLPLPLLGNFAGYHQEMRGWGWPGWGPAHSASASPWTPWLNSDPAGLPLTLNLTSWPFANLSCKLGLLDIMTCADDLAISTPSLLIRKLRPECAGNCHSQAIGSRAGIGCRHPPRGRG